MVNIFAMHSSKAGSEAQKPFFHRALANIASDIVGHIGCLYNLAEVVSNVDFLLSLAEACTLSQYGKNSKDHS